MDEVVDRGPFAELSPEVFEALVRRVGVGCLKRQVKEIDVRDLGGWDFDEFPGTIDGAMAWFSEARDEVPEEYRDRLMVDLCHDEESTSLRVWYERPETDEEMRVRMRRYLTRISDDTARERCEYERLRAKFEEAG